MAQRRQYASAVKDARARRGVSQVQLAEQLGVSKSTISMIEIAAVGVAPETVRSAVQWAMDGTTHEGDGPQDESAVDDPAELGLWDPVRTGSITLYHCPPYSARITEGTCELNRARAMSNDPEQRPDERAACRDCPGVVALAKDQAA